MRRGNVLIAIIATLILVQFTACNKADKIGDGIVNNDNLITKHTNSSFKFFNEKVDSVLTFENQTSVLGNHFICGSLNEPIFGQVSSDIYSQFRMGFRANFDVSSGFTVDSASLILYYNSTSFYGDSNALVSINIHELSEAMDTMDTYYSNQSFNTFMTKIGGSKNAFLPNLKDSLTLYSNQPGGQIDTTIIRGAIKVPLNDQMFFNKLLFDSLMFRNPDSLTQVINGLKISADTDDKRLIGFNIPSSFIRVHYSSIDTNYIVNYLFETDFYDKLASTVNYKQNYSGSIIADNLKIGEDSLGFVRGMSGVMTRVELQPNDSLIGNNITIAHAELSLKVKSLFGDNLDYFQPSTFLTTSTIKSDGSFVFTSDAQKAYDAFRTHANIARLKGDYGGVAFQNEDKSWEYKINITSYYQDYLDGTESGTFYINMPAGREIPSRVVFCGPNNVQGPAILTVTYTEF